MLLQPGTMLAEWNVYDVGTDLDSPSNPSRPRIMVVEDDPDTANLIKKMLMAAGYDVSVALGGHEVFFKIEQIRPDLILLDLHMPVVDGWQVLEQIRLTDGVPVVILTANGIREDAVRALSSGADDYISKPFLGSEVLARIKNILRRNHQNHGEMNRISMKNGLVIDMDTREVTLNQHQLYFSPKEFDLLLLLAKNAPRVVRYDQISSALWGEVSPEAYRRSKYLVYLIRRKFGQLVSAQDMIVNIDRIGYKFVFEAY